MVGYVNNLNPSSNPSPTLITRELFFDRSLKLLYFRWEWYEW